MEETISLREYFEGILAEKEKNLQNIIQATKDAVIVAERNSEKWRDNANEWRAAMIDKDKLFLLRSEFQQYKESQEQQRIKEKDNKDALLTKYIGWVIAMLAIAFDFFTKK